MAKTSSKVVGTKVDWETYQLLKIACSKLGISSAAYIRKLIIKEVKKLG